MRGKRLPAVPSAAAILDELGRQAPWLAIRGLRPLARGYDKVVFAADGGLVVRVGVSGDARENMPLERRVLRLLAGRTTLAIPRVVFAAEGGAVDVVTRIPGGWLTAARYAALDGDGRRLVAEDLARFLAELHGAVPARAALAAGVPARSGWPLPAEDIAARIVPLLGDGGARGFVERALAGYGAIEVAPDERVLVHNDLDDDNMGFDPAAGRLRGVFDFGDVALDDRHRDFRCLASIDVGLHHAVRGTYMRLTGRRLSQRRIRLYAAAGELSELARRVEDEGGPAEGVVRPGVAELEHRLGPFIDRSG